MIDSNQAILNVGPNVKRLRKAEGLTLVKLGELTGLSHTYLSQVETGKRIVSLGSAIDLANVFGITLNDLIGSGEKMDKNLDIKSIKEDVMKLVLRIEDFEQRERVLTLKEPFIANFTEDQATQFAEIVTGERENSK